MSEGALDREVRVHQPLQGKAVTEGEHEGTGLRWLEVPDTGAGAAGR